MAGASEKQSERIQEFAGRQAANLFEVSEQNHRNQEQEMLISYQ